MAETTALPKKVIKPLRTEPREFIFRLTKKYPEFFPGSSPYAARLALPMMDDILWPYIDGKPVNINKLDTDLTNAVYQPRQIRYVSGANSHFVDEQELGNDAYKLDTNNRNRLLDNEVNRDRLTFERGEIKVAAFDTTLKNYLWCRNDSKNQHPFASQNGMKQKQLNIQYEMIDFGYADREKVSLGLQKEKAYEIARTARLEEMIPHAKFLNIQFNHSGTDEAKDMEAVREDYKDIALNNPKRFLDTFDDPRVKIIYHIRSLVEKGNISIGGRIAGQAHWAETGTMIAQLPPDKEPIDFLAEYALTKAGEEFSNNLRAFKQ